MTTIPAGSLDVAVDDDTVGLLVVGTGPCVSVDGQAEVGLTWVMPWYHVEWIADALEALDKAREVLTANTGDAAFPNYRGDVLLLRAGLERMVANGTLRVREDPRDGRYEVAT